MASLWTSKTQSGRNNCGKDSCVLNVQYCCENVGLYIFLFINSFLMCTNYDGFSIHAQNKRFISSHLCLYTWNKILPPLYFVSVSM